MHVSCPLFQTLRLTTEVLCGRVKGEMPLPLPPGTEALVPDDDEQDGSSSSKNTDNKTLLHTIESAVIEWTRQIRAVLKRDSAKPLMEGFNPGALVECDFWVSMKKNLQSLKGQLYSPRVQKMQEILDDNQSSYGDSLRELIQKVDQAFEEADDICKYLDPVRVYLETLEDAELEALPRLLKQIFYTLKLVWINSNHYNTARRMVVLIREIVNQIISVIVSYVEPRSLFGQELEEGCQKPKQALKILQLVMDNFHEARLSILEEAKAGKCNPWEFESTLVFSRMEAYKARLEKIRDVYDFFNDFSKLEKVEVSGDKLNNEVKAIFTEQSERLDALVKETGDEGYDCLDPLVLDFDATHEEIVALAADFDRRLGSVAVQSFARINSLEAAFKLIIGFQGLLDRPDIADDVCSLRVLNCFICFCLLTL